MRQAHSSAHLTDWMPFSGAKRPCSRLDVDDGGRDRAPRREAAQTNNVQSLSESVRAAWKMVGTTGIEPVTPPV
jgi:hypothetical protein